MRVFLFVVTFLLFALTLPVFSQSNDCNQAGTVLRESYDNLVSFRERYYTVYLPPCYDSETADYPLLLLLHGSNADDSQWVRLGFNGCA